MTAEQYYPGKITDLPATKAGDRRRHLSSLPGNGSFIFKTKTS